MATLSPSEIKGYASGAGFTGNDLTVAVAVALAESGGDPRNHNPNPPDNSYGLWQINMLGDMGPDRRKRFGLKSNEELYDPATNARVAYRIYKEQGGSTFKPWTTYTRGTYKKFMDKAGGAVSDTDAGTATEPTAGTTDGGIVTGGLNALGGNIFRAVQSVGASMVGILLIIAAVVILIMQSRTGNNIVKKGVKKVL
jgi:lysozyme-like protein